LRSVHLDDARQQRDIGIKPSIETARASTDVQLRHCRGRQIFFAKIVIDA
jgi:hypothetical protein